MSGDGHEDMVTLYYLPDLGVTGHDRGGPYIDLYAGDPGTVAAAVELYRGGGVPAPELAPFDVVNTWDYAAGRRRPLTLADIGWRGPLVAIRCDGTEVP